MGSQSRSKSNSKQRKDQNRRRSSPSSSSSSRSKRSRGRKSRSASRSRERPPRYQGGYQRREPEAVAPNPKLFVTNIDSKFSQEELDRDLRSLFEPFGTIKEIIVKTKHGSTNSYCFIEYQEVEAASKAQTQLKGKDFKGKELKVEFGRGARKNDDRRSDLCYICHKEGHFAKDCHNYRPPNSNYDDKYRRDDRGRDRDYRGRDNDRDYRDKGRDNNRRKYSSSSSRSYRRRDRDREDYRDKESRRSPEKRSSNYNSSNSRRY